MKDIQLIKNQNAFINIYYNPFEDLEIVESFVDYIGTDCYVSGKLLLSTYTLEECLEELKPIGLNVVDFVNSYEDLG